MLCSGVAALVAVAVCPASVWADVTPAAAPAGIVAQATGDQCTADTRLTTRPPAFQTLQAERAWSVTRGGGATVAVVDSGVSPASPHLAGAVLEGTNLVDDKTDKHGLVDLFAHGTALAGQIAARPISGSGVEGLAPDAKILPVRVYSGRDEENVKAGTAPDIGRLAEGIRYAADHDAQIINVSLSTTTDDPRLSAAVSYAVAKGSLLVASADNRDTDGEPDGVRYPAGYDGVIGVAAVGLEGTVTGHSIRGPHVSLSAPGQNVLSVSPTGGDCIFSADEASTSYAAAYVAAAAALVAAAHPDETAAQWTYRLEQTARRADPDSRDDVSGWGVVQPYSALTLVPGADLRGPDNPFVAADDQTAAAATAPPVVVDDLPPMNAQAWALTSVVGVLALAALGTAGTLAVLRRRRSRDDAPLTGRGLYGDEPDGADVS